MTNQDLKRHIDELVEGDRDAIISAMQQILSYRTVSGADDREGQDMYRVDIIRCLEFLESKAREIGLEWKNHDNEVAFAHLAGGNSFVGLPVHIDVVPVNEGWTQDPFGGEIIDGVIYGRGCQDDKGPVIQMLYALKVLKALGGDFKRGARMIIGTTEEHGDWTDIKRYLELEDAPEMSIVPDSQFPIINGEKGVLNLRLEGKLPVDETPDVGGLRFKKAIAGDRPNIVPPTATLIFEGEADSDGLRGELDRFLSAHPSAQAEFREHALEKTIIFHGKGAHGSTPEEGRNAALDLLQFMTDSGFVSDDEADMADFLHRTGEGLHGENLKIAVEHAFIGPTTVNLGILKWVREDVEVIYNIRNTMGLSVEDTVRRCSEVFEEFAEETGFELSAAPKGKAMEPIYVNPEEYPEFIEALKEAYKEVTGRDATLNAMGGTTYAKAFPNAVNFGPVDLADGEVELAHQNDERVSVENLLRNVKIYAYALARLCVS